MTGSPVTLRLHVGRLNDSTGAPIVHRINDIDVDPAVVADVQVFARWAWREMAQREQCAELLRRQVAELTRERDELIEESRRWRVVLQAAEAEAAREIERLRGLLVEALSSWEGLARTLCAEHCHPDGEGHDGDVCGADLDTVERIRREAGLQ